MKMRQPSYRQKGRNVKSQVSSESPRLIPIVGFAAAVVLTIMGVLVCILNIINIIYGPWTSIIGVIFAGVGLIVALYASFIRERKG